MLDFDADILAARACWELRLINAVPDYDGYVATDGSIYNLPHCHGMRVYASIRYAARDLGKDGVPIHKRGRPRSINPRTTGLLLSLTKEELRLIKQRAKQVGKPKARWIRELALAA